MAGKQAKILSEKEVARALKHLGSRRHRNRDRCILLLSVKAGLRAGEISKLTWSMVLDADHTIGQVVAVRDAIAKKRSGRSIPMHPDLKKALERLHRSGKDVRPDDPVIQSERAAPMTAASMVNWFARLYAQLGFVGCSSHSGRRSFVTYAARRLDKAGASLRDVQQMAGHASLEQTAAYVEGDTEAKRRLVALL